MKLSLIKVFRNISRNIFQLGFTIIFISCVFTSCDKNTQQDSPSNIISESQMMQLLIDFHRIDAYVALKTDSTQKYTTEQLKQTVLSKQGFTMDQYREAVASYSKNTIKLDSMYDRILTRLSEMRASQNLPIKKPTKTK